MVILVVISIKKNLSLALKMIVQTFLIVRGAWYQTCTITREFTKRVFI